MLAGGYDQAADVWSAGVILYILLSGRPPFGGETKTQIFDAVRAADLRFPSNPWNAVSDSAKELIKGMLCTDTSKRLTAMQVLGKILFLCIDDGYCTHLIWCSVPVEIFHIYACLFAKCVSLKTELNTGRVLYICLKLHTGHVFIWIYIMNCIWMCLYGYIVHFTWDMCLYG